MMKKLSLCCLAVVMLPTLSMAKYCIQVSSVRKVDKNSLVRKIHLKTFQNQENVRIEEVGRYYTLRVGDFKTTAKAKSSLRKIKKDFPHAYIRKCEKRNVIYSLNQTDIQEELPYKRIEKKRVVFLPPNYETKWSPKKDTF